MALNPDISNVLEKVTKEIKKYHPDAEYSASRYIEYSPKWGNGKPMLTMHKDSDIKEGDTTPYEVARDIKKERVICFDYQLDSNTDWPLIVENLEFGLQNNDALLMYPEKQLHGRPDKNFNNFEFV